MNLVINRFLRNDYPIQFLGKCMEKFIVKFHNNDKNAPRENRKCIYIAVPFVNNFYTNKFNHIARKLKLDGLIKFYYKTNNLAKMFLNKERLICDTNCYFCTIAKRLNICNIKCAVYIIECAICNKMYIGETERLVKDRVGEHLVDINSAVFKHHNAHHTDVNIYDNFSFDILYNSTKLKGRLKYIESIYISNNIIIYHFISKNTN